MENEDGRVCTKCNEWKNRTSFQIDKYKRDRMSPRCRKCQSVKSSDVWVPAALNVDLSGRACSKCGTWKPKEQFHASASRPDGMYSCCKTCKGPDLRKHRKVNTAKATARTMRWRASHPEKFREAQTSWRARNAERCIRVTKEWRDRNRGKIRLYVRMSNSRRRSNGMRNPIRLIAELQRRQNGKCAICRVSITDGFHVDHIMPLALGGDNLPRNVQLLCVPCNLSKAAKHPVDFMRSKGFLL